MHRRESLVSIQAGVTFACLCLLVWCWLARSPSLDGTVYMISLLFTLHTVWGIVSWYWATGRWLDAYIVVFLSMCAFHGGTMILRTFALVESELLPYSLSGEHILGASSLSLACIASFHLGALLFARWQQRRPVAPGGWHVSIPRARLLGVVFFSIGLPCAVISVYYSARLVGSLGYMAMFQEGGDYQGLLWAFGNLAIPGSLYLLASMERRVARDRLLIVISAVLAFVNIYVGSRGMGVSILIACGVFYDGVVRRQNGWVISGIGVLSIIVFSIIGDIRTVNFEDRVLYLREMWQNGLDSSPIVKGLTETGGTLSVVSNTIAFVPDLRPFDWGMGYVRAVLVIVPNIVGADRGLYSEWYMQTWDPVGYAKGGGAGFSAIAEAYANFSWFGAPIALLLLGGLVGGFVEWGRIKRSAFLIAVESVVALALFVFPRSELGFCLRPVIWFGIVPLLACRDWRRKTSVMRDRRVTAANSHE